MAYIETTTSKLDWAMPFQRTGKFPLDRTAIFSSYADVVAYAKQDGSDSRKLGGTSYVGQIVAVYGPLSDAANAPDEVAAYIITAVGATPGLMKLAQTTATGDFATDISALYGAISDIEARLLVLEQFKDTEEDKVDNNTKYEFETATTTDGAIKITNLDDNTSQEVKIKGWQSLVDLATGRTSAYVYANPNDPNLITDSKNNKKFKIGDLIYYTDTNIADQWVVEILSTANSEGSWYRFADLEVEKVDLKDYITSDQIAAIYATKEAIKDFITLQPVTDLANRLDGELLTITEDIADVKEAIGTVKTDDQGNVISLQAQIDNIDVTAQINTSIGKLNADKVGGTDRSYIKEIKQTNGIIEAVAATLPEVDIESITADDAGEQGDHEIAVVTSVTKDTEEHKIVAETSFAVRQAYVDDLVSETAKNIKDELIGTGTSTDTISNIASRVKVIEDAKYGDSISALQQTTENHATEIGDIKTRLTSTESVATNAQSRVATLETTVAGHTTAITNL